MLNVSLDDPSEWPCGFAALKKIDSLLRCPICLEFLDIAVMVPKCAHSYCSFCIRKHITYKECCPTCASPVAGGDLKCNRLLDQLVGNFKIIRKKLIRILKLYVENPSFSQKPKSKDRKKSLQETKENISSADEFQFEGGTPLFRNPKNSQTKKLHRRNPIDAITITDNRDVETTFCPVCTKKIPLEKINGHLDTCLAGGGDNGDNAGNAHSSTLTSSPCATPSTKRKRCGSYGESPTSPFTSPMRPIVLTSSLNSLQDRELKSKANEYELNTQGTRKQLIRRIEQYILLYNSQCDALEPMSKSMIAKEVIKNERNLNLHGYVPGIVIDTNDGRYTDEEKIDFCISYSKKHAKHYQTLIDQIKGRLKDQSAVEPVNVREDIPANADNGSECGETQVFPLVKCKDERETPIVGKEATAHAENEDEPILIIDSSDPSNKDTDEVPSKRKDSGREKFGYVPKWFDSELLDYSLDKQTMKPNGDVVKVTPTEKKASEKNSRDKGTKRKLKKTKSTVSSISKKKTNVQSGNIASYFAGAVMNKPGKCGGNSSALARNKKKSVKPTDQPCCSKTVKKTEKPGVLIVDDDSDSQGDHDTTIRNTSFQNSPQCPPSSPTTVDVDEEDLEASSPSMLEDVKEDPPSALEDVEVDGPVLENEDEGAYSVLDDNDNEGSRMSGVDVLNVNSDTDSETDDELSPVLFRDSTVKRNQLKKKLPAAAEKDPDKETDISKTSSCSILNAEISELVDRAIANPREFDSGDSDTEENISFTNKSALLRKKPVDCNTVREGNHNVISGKTATAVQKSLCDVVPVPPTDFFFSQAEF